MRTARRGLHLWTLVVLVAGSAVAQPARGEPAGEKAGAASSPSPDTTIDPTVIAALERMGGFLRKQSSLQIKAVTNTDEVLHSGQVVQQDAQVELLVRRPDRLRASKISERKTREFYYDGKTFTMYAPKYGYYAQLPAPPSIQQLVEVLARRYGIDLPLADLFYWGTEKSGVREIKSAVDVGPTRVEGTLCDHYAFRQRDVDWQLWIQQGDQPLPRKMIVTTTSERAKPQHEVVLTWTLSPVLDDKLFAFVPPKDTLPIAIDDAERLARPSRQGRAAGRAGGGK